MKKLLQERNRAVILNGMDDMQDTPEFSAEYLKALGFSVQRKRVSERLTLSAAASQCGVSAATLSRLERFATSKAQRGFIPDTRTVALLSSWLDITHAEAISGGPKPPKDEIPKHHSTQSTPAVVRAHLRADRNLAPDAAAMLAEMFDLAYQQYAKLSGSSITEHNRDTGADE